MHLGPSRCPLALEARGFAKLYEQRRPLYHAAADALVDAEQLEGGEPLLVPLSPVSPNLPSFQFKSSDYWAQGLNFGLTFKF